MTPSNGACEHDKLVLEASEVSLSLLAELRNTGRKAFGPLGFTTLEALLLIYVGLGHTQPVELATLLGLVLPSLSTKTSKMVDAGLLQRESQNGDARRVRITLTDAGLETSRQLMRAWHDSNLIDRDKFSNEEMSAFIRIARCLTLADPEN